MLIVHMGTAKYVAKRRTLLCRKNSGTSVRKEGFDATVRSFAEVNKGFQVLTAEMTDYSKRAFEDGCRAWEQLVGAKSFERAFEIQSQYAKNAYDSYIAEVSKLGEMYASLARNAYKPVEQAVAKKAA
jgi:hypothetical protein